MKQYNSFLGAKVTRKRTLAKYLDAANFRPISPATVGANAFADPNSHFPDEIYYIDRKSSENPVSITLELAVAWDVTGVKLPLRQVIRDTCQWRYRDPDTCGYNGTAMFTIEDAVTFNFKDDACSKHLSGCKLRFGVQAQLPASFFPSVGLLR
jgi:lambda family phage minor tail protein L